MSKNKISVRKFIQDYLIDQIGDIKNTHPYFAFLLMAVGIEFLGKCQNKHPWDDYNVIKSRTNFENGLKIGPLKKYAKIKDLYDKLRNGLAHAFLIKDGISLSVGNDAHSINVNEFYDDFKKACELVLNAKDSGNGKIFTIDGIGINKNLGAEFFTVKSSIDADGKPCSITAQTQSNLGQIVK